MDSQPDCSRERDQPLEFSRGAMLTVQAPPPAQHQEGRHGAEIEAAQLRTALEATHDHLTRKILALDAAEKRAADLEEALGRAEREREHALATIRNMERSVFWRLRGMWARINRLAGRST